MIALAAGWGSSRLSRHEALVQKTPTLPVTEHAIECFAQLRAECKAKGHPLHQKQHMGDAWIAATAMSYDIPLFSADKIFSQAPLIRRFRAE